MSLKKYKKPAFVLGTFLLILLIYNGYSSKDLNINKGVEGAPFIPYKPIKKYYSGGYENSGYVEISCGLIENKSLSVVKDGAGLHVYIKRLEDDTIELVYYDNISDGYITLDILQNYAQNREEIIHPLNPKINSVWSRGKQSFRVTAMNKIITVPAGKFNTIEVTSTNVEGEKGYYYYAEGFGLIYSSVFGYESELIKYEKDVDINKNLIQNLLEEH